MPNDLGPFSEYLTAPLNPTRIKPTGFENPGMGIAYVANQFLDGIKQTRMQKFATQEMQRSRDLQAYNVALEGLQKSNLRDDVKNQFQARLLQGIAGTIAGDKDASSKVTGNPMTDVIKHMATNLIGGQLPKKTQPLDMNVLADMSVAMADPNMSADSHINELQQGYQQEIEEAKKKAAAEGRPFTREDAASLSGFSKLVNTLQGYKRSPQALEYIVNQYPDHKTAAIQSLGPKVQANLSPDGTTVFSPDRVVFSPYESSALKTNYGTTPGFLTNEKTQERIPISRINGGSNKIITADGREVYMDAAGAAGWKPNFSTANHSNRMYGIGEVTLDDAKAWAEMGEVFPGSDGKPIDLKTVPPGMVLAKKEINGNTTYYPVSPRQVVTTANNQVYVGNAYNRVPGAVNGPVPVGAARVGTTSSSSTPGIDPATGQTAQVITTRTTTPGGVAVQPPAPMAQASPVAAGTPAAAAASVPPSKIKTDKPTATPAVPIPVTERNKVSASLFKDTSGGHVPPVMTKPTNPTGMGIKFADYNTQLKRVVAIRSVANNMFGDTTQPELSGLIEFGDIADDPIKRARVGKAILVALQGIEHDTKGGDLSTIIKTEADIPLYVAEARRRIPQKSMAGMTPREKDALDASVISLSAMVALRSITGAGNAKFSTQALERDLPLIGVNTTDSRQFYNKMSHAAELIWDGARTTYRPLFDQESNEFEFYKNLVPKAIGLKNKYEKTVKQSTPKAQGGANPPLGLSTPTWKP